MKPNGFESMLNHNHYSQGSTLISNDNRELKQQRCEGNENYQKIDRFLLAKQQLGKYITLLCTFFCVVARLRHETS